MPNSRVSPQCEGGGGTEVSRQTAARRPWARKTILGAEQFNSPRRRCGKTPTRWRRALDSANSLARGSSAYESLDADCQGSIWTQSGSSRRRAIDRRHPPAMPTLAPACAARTVELAGRSLHFPLPAENPGGSNGSVSCEGATGLVYLPLCRDDRGQPFGCRCGDMTTDNKETHGGGLHNVASATPRSCSLGRRLVGKSHNGARCRLGKLGRRVQNRSRLDPSDPHWSATALLMACAFPANEENGWYGEFP